jgi:hypothetical protein
MGEESDPTVVRSLAVHPDDVVTAVESRREGRATVLRATPPYHARMRARLHVRGPDDPPAVVVEPTDLLDDDAPAYPTPDETEERVRERGEYTPEAHRAAHVEAVAEWRERVRGHLVVCAVVETPAGAHEVAIRTLGE